MTLRTLSPLLLVALAGGCTAGTEYHRPNMTMPAAFRAAPAAPGVATDGSWWTRFNDPILNDLVARGLANNLDIEIVLARVDRARAAAGAARAAQLPSGTIDGSAVRTQQSTEAGLGQLSNYVPDLGRVQNSFSITSGASWELDLAGGLKRGRQSAVAELEATVADSQAARVTVAAEIADAYLLLRTLQERRTLAVSQADAADKLTSLVQKRFDATIASRRELEQAKASAIAVRAEIPALEAGIEGQLNRLAVLTGEMPESERRGLDRPAPLPIAEVGPVGSPTELLRRRPDLIAAERRLAASHARIGAALAEYYPRFSLSGLFGFQSTSLGSLFTGPANVIQGGLGLRWRIFDFKRIDAEVVSARGDEREALATFRAAVLRAAEDVERSIVDGQAAQRRATLHAEEAVAAKRARDLAAQAYGAGHVSLVEVVDADRRSLQAADSLALARSDEVRAVVAAYRAIGGA